MTGGAGFIGSNYLNLFVSKNKTTLFVNVDCLTYAGSEKNITVSKLSNYAFEKVDIRDLRQLKKIFKFYKPTGLIHFAAESHVDLSLSNPSIFFETNVVGTHNLLVLSKEFGLKRFLQISTDEVYGPMILKDKQSKESDALNPTNPYSASKGSAELIALAYHKTFGLNVVISRSSNNYGPNQDISKLIPKFISSLVSGKKVSLYGKGEQKRNWIHVNDNIGAIELIFRRGKSGQVYNVGGGFEISNLDLTKKLIKLAGSDEKSIEFVTDRLGHDFRYAIDISKIKKELDWQPKISFEAGLRETFNFYKSLK